jgi:hypothetical protein
MEVHRVDAHQNEAEAIPAMCAAREIRETEKATLNIMLILCNRGRCYQLTHQSPSCSPIRLHERRFLIRPICIP